LDIGETQQAELWSWYERHPANCRVIAVKPDRRRMTTTKYYLTYDSITIDVSLVAIRSRPIPGGCPGSAH
jgi:hypothetical protein